MYQGSQQYRPMGVGNIWQPDTKAIRPKSTKLKWYVQWAAGFVRNALFESSWANIAYIPTKLRIFTACRCLPNGMLNFMTSMSDVCVDNLVEKMRLLGTKRSNNLLVSSGLQNCVPMIQWRQGDRREWGAADQREYAICWVCWVWMNWLKSKPQAPQNPSTHWCWTCLAWAIHSKILLVPSFDPHEETNLLLKPAGYKTRCQLLPIGAHQLPPSKPKVLPQLCGFNNLVTIYYIIFTYEWSTLESGG